jgi:hypothetical protein
MTYRWTRRDARLLGFHDSDLSSRDDKEKLENISSFCRVDVVEPEENVSKRFSSRHEQEKTGKNWVTSWHCSECGDGPYGFWQVSCQRCSHPKCSFCEVSGE